MQDPFTAPRPDVATAEPPGVRFNASALAALAREVSREPVDIDAVLKKIRDRNASRRYDAPAEDEELAAKEARRQAASAVWSPLDVLALRRAGAAILVADGRGEGVTSSEAHALCSRKPELIAQTAREIVRRMADPGIDSLIIERTEAGNPFLPQSSDNN